MECTRWAYGKTDKTQAHHIIQSFKPGEITPEEANELGEELAKKVAPGHEAVVYTHTDQEHVHNHIVVNSVNVETGRKLDLYRKLEHVRSLSDQICREHGKSIIVERDQAPLKFSRAEYGLQKRGIQSWKDEVREAVDQLAPQCQSFDEFQRNLKERYNVSVERVGKKHLTYTHPNGKKVRDNKLGAKYSEKGIAQSLGTAIEKVGEMVKAIPVPVVSKVVGGVIKATGKTVKAAGKGKEIVSDIKQKTKVITDFIKEETKQLTKNTQKTAAKSIKEAVVKQIKDSKMTQLVARMGESEIDGGTALDRRLEQRDHDIHM